MIVDSFSIIQCNPVQYQVPYVLVMRCMRMFCLWHLNPCWESSPVVLLCWCLWNPSAEKTQKSQWWVCKVAWKPLFSFLVYKPTSLLFIFFSKTKSTIFKSRNIHINIAIASLLKYVDDYVNKSPFEWHTVMCNSLGCCGFLTANIKKNIMPK